MLHQLSVSANACFVGWFCDHGIRCKNWALAGTSADVGDRYHCGWARQTRANWHGMLRSGDRDGPRLVGLQECGRVLPRRPALVRD